MFESITSFIEDKLSTRRQEEKADDQHLMHLAAAALLLEVSRADFNVQDEELEVIAKALQRRFNFAREEMQNLLDMALAKHDEHISIHPFVKIINDGCTPQEKRLLLQDLWEVAYADDKLDKYEEYQIRKIADLLYLPHSVFIQTKLKAQEG